MKKQIKNIIVGKRSNLSHELNKFISNSIIVNANEFKKIQQRERFNLILNHFYSSSKLKSNFSLELFFKKTLIDTIKILEIVNKKKINKIIYTSSCSVNFKDDGIENMALGKFLYKNTKILNERIIINFCETNKISYGILRLHNLYGGNDSFSIINTLTKSHLNSNKVYIFNKKDVRDFIHVQDVAKIYKKLISIKKNFVSDLGTGKGISLSKILSKMNLDKNKIIILNKGKKSYFRSSNLILKKINYKHKFINLLKYLDTYNTKNYHKDEKKN